MSLFISFCSILCTLWYCWRFILCRYAFSGCILLLSNVNCVILLFCVLWFVLQCHIIEWQWCIAIPNSLQIYRLWFTFLTSRIVFVKMVYFYVKMAVDLRILIPLISIKTLALTFINSIPNLSSVVLRMLFVAKLCRWYTIVCVPLLEPVCVSFFFLAWFCLLVETKINLFVSLILFFASFLLSL